MLLAGCGIVAFTRRGGEPDWVVTALSWGAGLGGTVYGDAGLDGWFPSPGTPEKRDTRRETVDHATSPSEQVSTTGRDEFLSGQLHSQGAGLASTVDIGRQKMAMLQDGPSHHGPIHRSRNRLN